MHVKSWRLWLCLGALLAATVPWKLLVLPNIDSQTLDQIADSYLQIRQTDWLLFAPILILITVDTVARMRVVGVHPLLFTKPFSPLSYFLACWAAVVVVAGLLAGPTLAVRYLVGRFFFGLTLPFAPFGWLLALVAMPTAMGLTAVVILIRTIAKHNVSAYLISAVLAGAIFGLTDAYNLPFLGWNRELIRPLIQPYVPAIGRDLDWARYESALGNTALLSLLFVAMAGYYLRRLEPQRKVRGDRREHWFNMPTFRRLLSDLQPDRRVGAAVHLAFLMTIVAAGAVGYRWARQNKQIMRQIQNCAAQVHDLHAHGAPTPGLMIRRYAGAIHVLRGEGARCDLHIEIANTTETAVGQIALSLPFGVDVCPSEDESSSSPRRQPWGNIVTVGLFSPLPPGSTATIHLTYSGHPRALEIGEQRLATGLSKVLSPLKKMVRAVAPRAWVDSFQHRGTANVSSTQEPYYDVQEGHLDDVGLALGARYVQINGWLLPRAVALVRGNDNQIVPVEMPRLFTANLQIGLLAKLDAVSPDGAVESLGQKDGWFCSRLRIEWPRSNFALFAGPYETIEKKTGPLPLRVRCFPDDREIILFALAQMNETVERWGLIFGPPKSGWCELIEAPAFYRTEDRLPPGILSAADLDRLRRYRPLLQKHEREGFTALDVYQSRLSAALLGRILRDSFHPDTSIRPLRDALYSYLIGTVQRSELGTDARKSARLFQQRRVGTLTAFLDPVRAARFGAPLAQRLTTPAFESFDATHIWRMLHYLLEDDKFAALLRSLVNQYGDRIVTLPDLRAAAERVQGGSLDWFFNQWFFGTGAPKYEILEARATMTENERTREIEYDVRIAVVNKGRGRMPVPIVLQTERDRITRMVWLDSQTTETMLVHVPDRPETVFVDPEGWITQETSSDRETHTRGPAWRKVRIFE